MRIGRTEAGALVLVEGADRWDVSQALNGVEGAGLGRRVGDPVIAALPRLGGAIATARARAERCDAPLGPPVMAPGKIVGAPVNYRAHLDEARADAAIHHGGQVHAIDEIGCFLKATSALAGDGASVPLPFDDRRTDHEAEVCVVIGRGGRRIAASEAKRHVAGYCLGLDMTVRGKEDRSLRKSCDGFAVLGPWLTTPDEIADPADIRFDLTVNGGRRQAATTAMLVRSVPELIEMVSRFYTLEPGDVIMTGTPEGVSAVASGDEIVVSSPDLGTLRAHVQ